MLIHRHEVLSYMDRKNIAKQFAIISLKMFHFLFLFCISHYLELAMDYFKNITSKTNRTCRLKFPQKIES